MPEFYTNHHMICDEAARRSQHFFGSICVCFKKFALSQNETQSVCDVYLSGNVQKIVGFFVKNCLNPAGEYRKIYHCN